jgi:hypothetical protein
VVPAPHLMFEALVGGEPADNLKFTGLTQNLGQL